MICPACEYDGEPLAVGGDVAICAECGASVVPTLGRKATMSDIEQLSEGDIVRLRHARAKWVRP